MSKENTFNDASARINTPVGFKKGAENIFNLTAALGQRGIVLGGANPVDLSNQK